MVFVRYKKRYFTCFLYHFRFTVFRRVYNGFVITCKKPFSLTTSHSIFYIFWICLKIKILIRIVLFGKKTIFFTCSREKYYCIFCFSQKLFVLFFLYTSFVFKFRWFIDSLRFLWRLDIYCIYFLKDKGISSTKKRFINDRISWLLLLKKLL